MRQRWLVALIITGLAALVFSGCASVPRLSLTDWSALLPEDCSLYFNVELTRSSGEVLRAVLEGLSEGMTGVDSLIERTDRIHGGVKLLPDVPPSIYTVIEGRYPTALIRMGMMQSVEWERMESPREYWLSKAGPLKVCMPRSSVILMTTGDIVPVIKRYSGQRNGPGARFPEPVMGAMESSEMVAFLPDFSHGALARSVGAAVPIRELWVTADPVRDGYGLAGFFRLEREESSGVVSRVLRLMLVYVLRQGKIEDFPKKLRSVEIVPEGLTVRVTGLVFAPEELARLLINFLSKGSQDDGGSG